MKPNVMLVSYGLYCELLGNRLEIIAYQNRNIIHEALMKDTSDEAKDFILTHSKLSIPKLIGHIASPSMIKFIDMHKDITVNDVKEISSLRLFAMGKFNIDVVVTDMYTKFELIDKISKSLDSGVDLILEEEFIQLQKILGATPRRTDIINDMDRVILLVAEKQIVIILQENNCLDIIEKNSLRIQNRGGLGINLKINHSIKDICTCKNTDTLIAIYNKNKAYRITPTDLPSRMYLNNILKLDPDESILSICRSTNDFMLLTQEGGIKIFSYKHHSQGTRILSDVSKAYRIRERTQGEDDYCFIASKFGRVAKIPLNLFRVSSRTSGTIKGMEVTETYGYFIQDALVMPDGECYVVDARGLVKVVDNENFRPTNRNVRGTIAVRKSSLVAILSKQAGADNHILCITKKGKMLLADVSEIRTISRVSRGVKLCKLEEARSGQTN